LPVLSYKCPNCGAELTFDPKSQTCKCDFCSSSFTEEELEKIYKEKQKAKKEDAKETGNTSDNIDENTVLYSCPRCGAQIITEKTTAATFCCYCHNPVIISEKLSGDFKPSKVIPFKIDRNTALESFLDMCKKKWFLPSDFSSQNQLDKITGMYVPFWLFNCDTNNEMSATAYKLTTWSDSEYHYTRTDTYDVFREACLNFKNVPGDASTKADDTLMQCIEPFDYSQIKDFSLSYLSGFFAEKYDKTNDDVFPIVKDRVGDACNNVLRNSISGYSSVSVHNFECDFNYVDSEYAMLPVWLMAYIYKGKTNFYAINGQTGKLTGALPVSKGKLVLLFFIVFTACFIALLLGGHFL
jgi:DNA-directed RNA polymerase subunit RPC12/RpoP